MCQTVFFRNGVFSAVTYEEHESNQAVSPRKSVTDVVAEERGEGRHSIQ